MPSAEAAARRGQNPAAGGAPRAITAVRTRLTSICLAHAAVDFFSAIVVPLLSVLEGRVRMTPAQGAMLVGVGSLSSGAIQPIVAWASDRYDTRWPGIIGLALAALAIGALGWADSFASLLAIQIVGTAGIGAFHPVGAAAMGQLSARRRSLGVAIFFTAGMVGGVAGGLFAPVCNRLWGMRSLAWTIPPGLLCVAALSWAILSVPHRHHAAHDHHRSLDGRERAWRWVAIGLLYAGNALRFTVNMALIQLVVRWCEQVVLARAGAELLTPAMRTDASTINGPMQAAMTFGMGAGGMALGLWLPHRFEKAALVLVPMLGSAAVAALPHGAPWAAIPLAAACGVAFGGVMPITISMGQRLLPHRTGLASGLMMGGAWMVAAAGPPLAQRLGAVMGLEPAFAVVGAMLCASGVVSLAIPGWLFAKTAGR